MANAFDRAVRVLHRTLESSDLQQVDKLRVFPLLQNALLVPAVRGAWQSCEGQEQFDTFALNHGVIFWPVKTDDQGEVLLPIICGVARVRGTFSIRLGVIRTSATKAIQGVGIRLESGAGAHEFHHAQLFTHASKNPATRLAHQARWLPEQQPSIPVQADNPLDLVWATAVSAYGRVDAMLPFDGIPNDERTALNRYLSELK